MRIYTIVGLLEAVIRPLKPVLISLLTAAGRVQGQQRRSVLWITCWTLDHPCRYTVSDAPQPQAVMAQHRNQHASTCVCQETAVLGMTRLRRHDDEDVTMMRRKGQ